jgi:hypothetical protein
MFHFLRDSDLRWLAFAVVLGATGTWAYVHLGDFIHFLDRVVVAMR